MAMDGEAPRLRLATHADAAPIVSTQDALP